jgi:adenylate kinase
MAAARKARRLVLFGAPGVGKGTQAVLLGARYKVPHVSTGDMLRAAIRAGTPEGLQARAIVGRGELVPDELISVMIGARLRADDVREGFILDGFPRTVGQAEYLDGALGERGLGLDQVVNILVPEEEIALRLTGRRVCGQCGTNFHVTLRPPRVSGVCDACGGALIQRPDDTLDVIQGRLKVYQKQTAPVLDYYRRHGVLAEVDGRGKP